MLAGFWQNLNVESVDAAHAPAWAGPWRTLTAAAAEPAGHNAPELVVPLLATLPNAKVRLVDLGAEALIALPYVSGGLYDASLETPLTACGTPHVSAAHAQESVLAFLKGQRRPFLLKSIAADGAVFSAFKTQATHFSVLHQWQRAALNLSGGFEDWFASNFDHKRRKEFKRLRNRLAEQGKLELEVLAEGQDVHDFVGDLLRLEAAGWKGERGTALDSEGLGSAFRTAMSQLHASGKLRFWRLRFDGKAIAALFAIVEGDHAWLGKIAYDESLAKYSPGVLIILDATESFFADGWIKRVDSCAIPNHPMIDRIWRDRIAMADVLVASDTVSAMHFDTVAAALRAHQFVRGQAKNIFYRLSKRKKS